MWMTKFHTHTKQKDNLVPCDCGMMQIGDYQHINLYDVEWEIMAERSTGVSHPLLRPVASVLATETKESSG
jgi:hypothetical protein